MLAPGDCSPSRNVVSKIRMRLSSAMAGNPEKSEMGRTALSWEKRKAPRTTHGRVSGLRRVCTREAFGRSLLKTHLGREGRGPGAVASRPGVVRNSPGASFGVRVPERFRLSGRASESYFGLRGGVNEKLRMDFLGTVAQIPGRFRATGGTHVSSVSRATADPTKNTGPGTRNTYRRNGVGCHGFRFGNPCPGPTDTGSQSGTRGTRRQ